MTKRNGRTVLITGASGAIGGETARRLAERGARLALSGRREQRLEELADEIASTGAERPAVLAADLSRRGEATDLANRALEALGSVDVLVNNAGATLQGLTWVVADRDEGRQVMETNLWSPLALSAVLAPRMMEGGGGTIVNVGSMIRVAPFPHLGTYAASKAALSLVSQMLQWELAGRGVRVVDVSLGPVDTPASHENRVLAGADRWLDARAGVGSAAGAAKTIVRAIERDAAGVVVYPRMLRWAYRYPAIGRGYARRMSRHADLSDDTVRLGGSFGADEVRALREQWEAAAGRPR